MKTGTYVVVLRYMVLVIVISSTTAEPMSPNLYPVPTPIFHITKLENIRSVLWQGLFCKSALDEVGFTYRNAAAADVQASRSVANVPVGPRGTIHDYVPFYFSPKSPMLFKISQGSIPGVAGQHVMVCLMLYAQEVEREGIPFVITDMHPLAGYRSYKDTMSEGLSGIDWEVIGARYWFNTEQDPTRRHRRQAEFMVLRHVPNHLFRELGVSTEEAQNSVAQEMKEFGMDLDIPVSVRPDWYY